MTQFNTKLTRFNGVTRVCSIPHPKAHATLVFSIADNWKNFEYILKNPASLVVPQRHADGRIVNMEYETSAAEATRRLSSSFSQRYLVETDISNCFPSIYSHSIPWALVGTLEAKRTMGNQNKWYNQLDKAVRWTKRNESTGVLIGPGTSDMLAEAILARVDGELLKSFAYTRYIDDYTMFCTSMEDAEKFILALSVQLAKYNLTLNSAKTKIVPIPVATADEWVVDLKNALPRKERVSVHDSVNYLDFTLRLSGQTPDGSVLKYGLKTIINKVLSKAHPTDLDTARVILRYALNLAFHQAVLVPLLDGPLEFLNAAGAAAPHSDIQALLSEHTRNRRSDAVSWLLYYAIKYGVSIPDECATEIMDSEDCIPILLLYRAGQLKHKKLVYAFAKSLDQKDLYRLDQFWLLLYELYYDNKITNPYATPAATDGVFEAMKAAKLRFVDFVTATP